MFSSRPENGTGPFVKFFRCSNDFIMQQVYFSRLMENYFEKDPDRLIRTLTDSDPARDPDHTLFCQ
jgi:hypothetical protein